MDSAHFSIKYDGPALKDHQMDVRELAPALIALSELLESANKIITPNAPEIRVNVKGNFKAGSFGIDLTLVQNAVQQIVALFSSSEASATVNLLSILEALGIGGGGFMGLILWLKGRKPSTIKRQDGCVQFEIIQHEIEEIYTVNEQVAKLYESRTIHKHFYKVLSPLEQDGIDIFISASKSAGQSIITKADVDYFRKSAEHSDIVSDTTAHRILLQIEAASFREGNKWRLSDGTAAFYAEIADQDFLNRINAGLERFGKLDVLVADLRRVQYVTDVGLKTEHMVTKIHEHHQPLQKELFPK